MTEVPRPDMSRHDAQPDDTLDDLRDKLRRARFHERENYAGRQEAERKLTTLLDALEGLLRAHGRIEPPEHHPTEHVENGLTTYRCAVDGEMFPCAHVVR